MTHKICSEQIIDFVCVSVSVCVCVLQHTVKIVIVTIIVTFCAITMPQNFARRKTTTTKLTCQHSVENENENACLSKFYQWYKFYIRYVGVLCFMLQFFFVYFQWFSIVNNEQLLFISHLISGCLYLLSSPLRLHFVHIFQSFVNCFLCWVFSPLFSSALPHDLLYV